MNKIYKKSIIFMAIFAFTAIASCLLLVNKTNAAYVVEWKNGQYVGYYLNDYTQHNIGQPTNTTDNTNTNTTTTVNKNTTNTTNKTNTTTTNKNNTKTSTDTDSNSTTLDSNGSKLAAGALFGSDSFMPSGFFQWVFFFILLMFAIILWRKLYVNDRERNKPLKHA